MRGLNVFSCFDGISCAQYTLKKLGIPVNKYYASEIDKRAIKITQHHFPNTIQYGNITKIKAEHFMSKIDLLCGGSPCQGFSFAGKQLNFDDPRSKLFFEFVRLKNELNPTWFFLENVRMVKKSQDIISDLLGVQPVLVNSALVSAQNRRRLYWTNIPGFEMPEDRNIEVGSILENGDTTILRWQNLKQGAVLDSKKAACLRASSGSDIRKRQKVQIAFINNKGIHREIEKASCLDANYFKGIDNHGARTMIKSIVKNSNGELISKFNTIDAEYGSAGVSANFKQSERRVYNIEDEFRKLTPTECERLQGLPDGYTGVISDSARYHALGNGWQIDTIELFFKHLKKII